jgi:hypothetical protein
VVLVGLMGSGKTTVGKKVARLVAGASSTPTWSSRPAPVGRWPTGSPPPGEDGFRDAEADLLAALAETATRARWWWVPAVGWW